MFYNQPLSHRFGTALKENIEDANWTHIEMAVAWVRRSGMKHLYFSLKEFLKRGGCVKITVGVDIENTSVEGLEDLLNLQDYGEIGIYIFHNEANATFHPKVYLFRNASQARLIVGSNNLTEAGLFVNTEAGLQLDAPLNAELIQNARNALESWRNLDIGFSKKLDQAFLAEMIDAGYVLSESRINQQRVSVQRSTSTRSSSAALFAARGYSVPPIDTEFGSDAQYTGATVLMRVRRASETARQTQIQIPLQLIETQFFSDIEELVSEHDDRHHRLIRASARGTLNTIKVEIPEIAPMTDPVLRLERMDNCIRYRAFDSCSVLGAPIRQSLQDGFDMTPSKTISSISDKEKATWWRFV